MVTITAGLLRKIGSNAETIVLTHHVSSTLDTQDRVIKDLDLDQMHSMDTVERKKKA